MNKGTDLEGVLISVSDRRGSGKPRPKSEGFELYNNSAQNGSPESPQMPWAEYSEPKKLPGDDRLMKNRADHRSSPNVASKRSLAALLPLRRAPRHVPTHSQREEGAPALLRIKEHYYLRRLANWDVFSMKDAAAKVLTGNKN